MYLVLNRGILHPHHLLQVSTDQRCLLNSTKTRHYYPVAFAPTAIKVRVQYTLQTLAFTLNQTFPKESWQQPDAFPVLTWHSRFVNYSCGQGQFFRHLLCLCDRTLSTQMHALCFPKTSSHMKWNICKFTLNFSFWNFTRKNLSSVLKKAGSC